MTVGPWKPITLMTYTTRIAEVDVRTDVSDNLDALTLAAEVTLSSSFTGVIEVQVKSPTGEAVASDRLTVSNSKIAKYEKSFGRGDVDLWFPVGYGKQSLYSLHLTLLDEVSKFMTLFCRLH